MVTKCYFAGYCLDAILMMHILYKIHRIGFGKLREKIFHNPTTLTTVLVWECFFMLLHVLAF